MKVLESDFTNNYTVIAVIWTTVDGHLFGSLIAKTIDAFIANSMHL